MLLLRTLPPIIGAAESLVLNDILTTVSFICKRCGKQFSDNCPCASYESEPWRAGKVARHLKGSTICGNIYP